MQGQPRAGFTLIETLLASALGSIVVLGIVVLLGVIDRTERLTGARERDTAALAQLHLIMERSFDSLVMMDGMLLNPRPERSRPGTIETLRSGGASEAVRPRMLLEAEGGARSARPPRNDMGRQRLELVLAKSPTPPGWGGGVMVDTSYMAEDPEVRAVRGVFEVRPGQGKRAAREKTWTLWWRPLPPAADEAGAGAYLLDPTEDERAVVVAEGLTECQWVAFKERKRGGEIVASRFDELPAYMEMQVRTASGLAANWMFEVQWSNGPETGAEADTLAEIMQPGGPAGTGATGATGAAGAAGAAGTPVKPITKQGGPTGKLDTRKGTGKTGAAH
jgi:hypothetical protein